MTLQEDGALLLFIANTAVAIWRDGKLEYVFNEIDGEHDRRFNDVIADPVGRVFCGVNPITMPPKDWELPSGLYRLDTDGSITTVLEGIGISNGMGFTLDRKQMYYTDTHLGKIYLFDYDQNTGELANRRIFVETPANHGYPDGMTVDAEGYIWSAMWDGGSLVRYNTHGIEERRIQFPARKVSSITFGGEDLMDLYVTTGGGYNRSDEGSGAGALFRLSVGVQGIPEFFSRIGI